MCTSGDIFQVKVDRILVCIWVVKIFKDDVLVLMKENFIKMLLIYKLIWSLLSSCFLTVTCFLRQILGFLRQYISSFFLSFLFHLFPHFSQFISLRVMPLYVDHVYYGRVARSRKGGKCEAGQETK